MAERSSAAKFSDVIPESGISGNGITLRAVKPADLDLLAAWFSDAAVYAYWGGEPLSRDEVIRQFFDGKDDDVAPMVVESGGVALGYIQAWCDSAASGGIDVVLLPHARGRSIGPAAVRLLAHWLRAQLDWTRITVDPLRANDRAIRAFEAAGFALERECFADDGDRHALMAWADGP